MSRACNRVECQLIGFHTAECDRAATPATEFHLTLDRRELASILAGLRLLREFAGPGSRNYAMCRLVDKVSSEDGAIEPLSDAEIAELARRLG